MIWRKLGVLKMRTGTSTNLVSARTRDHYKLVPFTLGPHRQIACGCRRVWTDHPHEVALLDTADTCVHIRALYENGYVTSLSGASRSTVRYRLGEIRLTPLGQEMFGWRYAALALK